MFVLGRKSGTFNHTSTPNSRGKSLILHPDTVLEMTAIGDFNLPLGE